MLRRGFGLERFGVLDLLASDLGFTLSLNFKP